MTLEELRALYAAACQRVQETADAVAALGDDATPDEIRAASDANVLAVTEADQAKASVDQRVADDERQAAIQRGREAHPAPNAGQPAEARHGAQPRGGGQREAPVYNPTQSGGLHENRGYFHDIALAQTGDPAARERLIRNNRQAIEEALNRGDLERAGDLTTATHMGEFVKPDWTNDLYANVLRAGRAFADRCEQIGEPKSTAWSLPRITTGATAAVQTEGSALSNTDQVSDSINGVLQTIGGRSVASYQLVELAEPGMDAILFQDLVSAVNQQVDTSLLNSSTTDAKGLFQLSGINSVTFTQTTPTAAGLYPAIFQAKNAIEKNTFLPVDFAVMNPATWNWYLSQLDSQSRPFAMATSGAAFNNMALYDVKGAQGLAGSIGDIPVVVDANVPVNTGAGTNQGSIGLVNRSALLKKESAIRTVATPIVGVTSLTWNFVAYVYLQRIFGRHPLKISAITGTGLIVQSGF